MQILHRKWLWSESCFCFSNKLPGAVAAAGCTGHTEWQEMYHSLLLFLQFSSYKGNWEEGWGIHLKGILYSFLVIASLLISLKSR